MKDIPEDGLEDGLDDSSGDNLENRLENSLGILERSVSVYYFQHLVSFVVYISSR